MILIADGVKVFCGPSLLKGWIDDATYPAGWKKEIRNLADDDEIVPSGHFGKTYRIQIVVRMKPFLMYVDVTWTVMRQFKVVKHQDKSLS